MFGVPLHFLPKIISMLS